MIVTKSGGIILFLRFKKFRFHRAIERIVVLGGHVLPIANHSSQEGTEMKTLNSSGKKMALVLFVMLLGSPLVAQDRVGGMWHTIRYANGSWQQFGDVKTQTSDPGYFTDISIAGNNASGELHVIVQTLADGKLWHTIRYPWGWLPFGDVKSQAGNPGYVKHVAAAFIGDDLHVVVQTLVDGKLWHTIRYPYGWRAFADVKTYTGDPGYFSDISIAGNNASGELHLVGRTYDGKLWHTIRYANGGWQPFGDVKSQTGDPGYVEHPAVAFIGDDLHVVVQTPVDGKLWHTIRYPWGWQGFGDVKSQSSDPGYFSDISIAGNNASGELHVLAQTPVDGKLWHTIRYPWGWLAFDDVKSQATNPGYVKDVAAAFIGNDLHVIITN